MVCSHCNRKVGVLVVTAVVGALALARPVTAQDSASDEGATATAKSAEDRVKIQPYTGKPIYLDEPAQVAPPTIVRHETKTDKYEDGKVRTERQLALFSDNHFEADGTYKEYYASGKPFVEGKFVRGRQDGEWTYWFENGQINRKAGFKNGQPDGSWEVHRADGTLAAKRSFKEGLRHGEWVTYDKTGQQPLREDHYANGKRDGIWKTWYANGKQRQQNSFQQGKQHGTSIEWNDKGEKRGEVTYVDDKLDGAATLWLPDGRKVVQQYKEGRLVSESKQ